MNPQNTTTQDVAVFGVLTVLLIMSAFPSTAKFATYLGLFLLFLAMLTAWSNKTLQAFVQVFTQQLHGG